MGWHTYGTARISGDKEVIDLMTYALEHLADCAAISGHDADSDWLAHIFVDNVTEDGVFCDSIDREGDVLALGIRCNKCNGCDFFKTLSSMMGVIVEWHMEENELGEPSETFTYMAPRGQRPLWKVFTAQDIEEGLRAQQTPQVSFRDTWHPRTFKTSDTLHQMSFTRASDLNRAVTPETTDGSASAQRVITAQSAQSIYYAIYCAQILNNSVNGRLRDYSFVGTQVCGYLFSAGNEMLEALEQSQVELNDLTQKRAMEVLNEAVRYLKYCVYPLAQEVTLAKEYSIPDLESTVARLCVSINTLAPVLLKPRLVLDIIDRGWKGFVGRS